MKTLSPNFHCVLLKRNVVWKLYAKWHGNIFSPNRFSEAMAMNGISRRKRKAFTFHRIHWMCHCIEIQANQWTQILPTFLMLRVWLHPWCMQKLWIQTLWKLNDWTLALRLKIHAIYLKETVFLIVNEIYHAWCYLTDRLVIETQ